MNTHTYTAADELDRRAANKLVAPADKAGAPNTPEGKRLSAMGGAELRSEAGVAKPAKARKAQAPKAPKAERSPEQKLHTHLRDLAWAALTAERAAAKAEGRKARFTYAEACAAHGTTPAKAAK